MKKHLHHHNLDHLVHQSVIVGFPIAAQAEQVHPLGMYSQDTPAESEPDESQVDGDCDETPNSPSY